MVILIALAIGFVAGFVDSMAGGGGLISLPALMALGLPPKLALGTNKLQSCFGSLTAAIHFSRSGLIRWPMMLPAIVFTILGALVGTGLVQMVPSAWLAKLIPFLLVLMAIYMFWNRSFGLTEKITIYSPRKVLSILGLLLGFYDGFFGPGTGNFWSTGFIFFLGMNFKGATAHTKVVNFVSNAVALAIFSSQGLVDITIGLPMGLGQLLGASVGARLVILKGAQLIRVIFIIVVLLLAGRLFYQN